MTKCPYDPRGFTDCPDTSRCADCRSMFNPHYGEGRVKITPTREVTIQEIVTVTEDYIKAYQECIDLMGELHKCINERDDVHTSWYMKRLEKAGDEYLKAYGELKAMLRKESARAYRDSAEILTRINAYRGRCGEDSE